MIYRINEGDIIRHGLGIINDPYSKGFVFRIGAWVLRARWSTKRRKLFFGWHKIYVVE